MQREAEDREREREKRQEGNVGEDREKVKREGKKGRGRWRVRARWERGAATERERTECIGEEKEGVCYVPEERLERRKRETDGACAPAVMKRGGEQ